MTESNEISAILDYCGYACLRHNRGTQYFILTARDRYGTKTASIEERSDITVKQNILFAIRRFLDNLRILL